MAPRERLLLRHRTWPMHDPDLQGSQTAVSSAFHYLPILFDTLVEDAGLLATAPSATLLCKPKGLKLKTHEQNFNTEYVNASFWPLVKSWCKWSKKQNPKQHGICWAGTSQAAKEPPSERNLCHPTFQIPEVRDIEQDFAAAGPVAHCSGKAKHLNIKQINPNINM